jgi:Fic family protein
MSDDALTQAAEAVEPAVEPYRPFASFSDWLTRPYDGGTVAQFVDQLADMKQALTPEQLKNAVRIATNWAAVNTGAIEGLYQVDRGFTYSVAVSTAVLQEIQAQKGDSVADHIADAVRAYDFVLDAATGSHPLTEVWIRELHEIVTASQEKYTVITAVGPQEHDLPKGEYKRYPNNPYNFGSNAIHSYASPDDTPPEMSRFIEVLRSAEFDAAHPVVQAAYAHYAFVCVHPFADGNGRVARALSAMYLYRAYGLPLVIFSDQKADYIDALEFADRGDPSSFVRFVGERVIDTIGMIREQVLAAAIPDIDTQLEALRPLLLGEDGLAHGEIDAITQRLLDVFGTALEKQVSDQVLKEPLTARVQRYGGGLSIGQLPPGYRTVPGNSSFVSLQVGVNPPANVTATRHYYAATRLPGVEAPHFAIYRADGALVLEAYLRETHPTIAQALVFRADTSALREFRVLVAEASAAAAAALRQAGYLP